MKQDALSCSCGSRLSQILFVLSRELPRVMDIIGEMHDFDFVAFIQRQPELVFAEQRFCFHCLFAFVADCLYRLHVCYGTLAARATQVKPIPSQLSKSRAPRLGDCVFCSSDKCYGQNIPMLASVVTRREPKMRRGSSCSAGQVFPYPGHGTPRLPPHRADLT